MVIEKRKKTGVMARAAEPSTHAGIAALASALSYIFPQYALPLNVAVAAFGALAVGMREKGPAQAPQVP